MTDKTQPEAGSIHIIRYALELGLLWIDGDGRDKVREALAALDALEAQLEAVGAGGVQALSAAPAGFVPVAAFDRLHAHAESLAARLLAAEQAATKAAPGEPDYSEKWDAELGRTAMRFVDRAGDVHPGIDDAETICAEFHRAMSEVIERMPHVQRMAAPQQEAQEPATVPRFNCWSTNEGDSWFDHPADSQAIYDCLGDDAKVGDEYELTAGWKSVTARYRITEVVGDAEEYEVECISHPQENTAPQQEAQEPVAYAIFAENGNIRLWSTESQHVKRIASEQGLKLVKLYTAPQPAPAPLSDPRITAIEQAIRDYHYALDCRKHGGVAKIQTFRAICNAMKMHWVQGQESERRAALAAQGGRDAG